MNWRHVNLSTFDDYFLSFPSAAERAAEEYLDGVKRVGDSDAISRTGAIGMFDMLERMLARRAAVAEATGRKLKLSMSLPPGTKREAGSFAPSNVEADCWWWAEACSVFPGKCMLILFPESDSGNSANRLKVKSLLAKDARLAPICSVGESKTDPRRVGSLVIEEPNELGSQAVEIRRFSTMPGFPSETAKSFEVNMLLVMDTRRELAIDCRAAGRSMSNGFDSGIRLLSRPWVYPFTRAVNEVFDAFEVSDATESRRRWWPLVTLGRPDRVFLLSFLAKSTTVDATLFLCEGIVVSLSFDLQI